ncbi:hypothetical protein ACFLY6_00900 [Candidatus Dependentiae bacterium]
MNVLVHNLRIICDKIFSKVIDLGMEVIDFGNVFHYWTIGFGRAYNAEEFDDSLGDLCDAWDSLKKALEGKSIPGSVHVEWLGQIIEAAGYVMSKNSNETIKCKYEPLKIHTKDILALCKMIIKKIELAGVDKLSIDVDEYAYFNPEEAYTVACDPEIEMGSIKDDWSHLKKALREDYKFDVADLRRLGRLIKVVGYTLQQNCVPWFVFGIKSSGVRGDE